MINRIKNEKGILTVDFIFASMMVSAFSVIIFCFSMTLSVVEIVQYISFSVARNYSLAHENEDEQRRRAQEKYDELITNQIFRPFTDSGWFELRPVQIGNFNSDYPSNPDYAAYVGARIRFSAPILYKRIPMIGTTASDPDMFNANIQSYLSVEPTFEDCEGFMLQRANAFQNLTTTPGYSFPASEVHIMMDNGC